MCGTRRRRTKRRNSSQELVNNNQKMYNSGIEYNEINDQTGIYCFNCGANNESLNDEPMKFCRSCGTLIYKCPISKLPFAVGDRFAQCDNCKSIFHLHHFETWIQSNQNCPICRIRLKAVNTGQVGYNSVKMIV